MRREESVTLEGPANVAAPANVTGPANAEPRPVSPGSARAGHEATRQDTPDERFDLDPGTREGDYVIRGVIDRGGFGAVYRAEHLPTGAQRAMKVLHAELASTRVAIARFEREILAIQRIRHPNVVELFDVGRLPDGRPYFVMELLPGVDLGTRLRTAGRLAPDEVLAILEPLAEALDAAHAHAIVHRDLKPSNVFLSERDGRRRVVLLDFGVAKLLDEGAAGLTSSRQTIGTPSFMAPEQIRGQPLDARTDVYALGILVFTLLTGEPPFQDPDWAMALDMHLHMRPPRPSSRAPLDPALDAPVLRAISKDPAQRYASAGELLASLRRVIEASRRDGPEAPASGGAALHLEVWAEPPALEDPDDALLADLESVLPLAASFLEARGFRAALRTGATALYLLDLPADEVGDALGRRGALLAALSLNRALAARPRRDARVRVGICVHASPSAGDLQELAAWAPEPPIEGVLATRDATAGLDAITEPVAGPRALARIFDAA